MFDTAPMPEHVAQLARQSGFGSPGEIITLEDTRWFDTGATILYPFGEGCIVWPVKYQPVAFRWPDVLAYYQSVTRICKNNSSKYTEYKYRLELADGRVIAMEGHVDSRQGREHLQRVTTRIAPAIAGAQLPRMVHAFIAGEEIPFGPLAVAAGGVRRERRKLLPWTEFESVGVTKGILEVLRRRTPMLWVRYPVRKVPNTAAFIALTRFAAEHITASN